jgi:hypothetical protein
MQAVAFLRKFPEAGEGPLQPSAPQRAWTCNNRRNYKSLILLHALGTTEPKADFGFVTAAHGQPSSGCGCQKFSAPEAEIPLLHDRKEQILALHSVAAEDSNICRTQPCR